MGRVTDYPFGASDVKYIAAALVVLSGAILWSAAVLATSWVYQAKGNRGAADMASYGGAAIVVVGFGALLAAYQTDQPK